MPTKILIIKPSSLGDIVHGLQVAAAIKRSCPDIVIDWVVRDCFSRIVKMSGIVRNVYLFHRHGGMSKFVSLIKNIRLEYYDYIFDMQGLARSGVMTYFSRGKRRIGRSDARELSWLAYDETVALPTTNPPHALDILFQFLKILDIEIPEYEKLRLSPTPSDGISNTFGNFQNEKELILLFPESRRKEKEWPYFHVLSKRLAKEFSGFKIVAVCQKDFKAHPAEKNFYNLAGQTSIDDVVYLIQKSSLVIANDSAPVHIAAAVQKKIVSLFGPTDPEKFGPYPTVSPWHQILRASDSKMSSISVDDVISCCKKLLPNSSKQE